MHGYLPRRAEAGLNRALFRLGENRLWDHFQP